MLDLTIAPWVDPLPNKLELVENAIDIWWADLDAPEHDVDAYRSLLDPTEIARMERLRLEHLRVRFIVRRGILRRLLAAYLECVPASVRYALNDYGKPELDHPGGDALYFNLSHSDACAIYALSRTGPVGVDVERVVAFKNMRQVAQIVFSESEQTELARLPDDQQVTAFYNGWTRKEAVVKALGQGISFPLQSFSVSMQVGEHAGLLRSQDRRLQALTLLSIPLPAPYIAACAVQLGQD